MRAPASLRALAANPKWSTCACVSTTASRSLMRRLRALIQSLNSSQEDDSPASIAVSRSPSSMRYQLTTPCVSNPKRRRPALLRSCAAATRCARRYAPGASGGELDARAALRAEHDRAPEVAHRVDPGRPRLGALDDHAQDDPHLVERERGAQA